MPTKPAPIPEAAIVEEKFLAATGPGGQNVNKVATAVQLRIDVFALGLAPEVYTRLRTLAGSKWIGDGQLLVTARTYRTQDANRADARARLAALIAKAHQRPVKRVKTRPSKAAKARRMEAKSARSSIKKERGRVTLD